jgi:hypothetical protein
MENCVKPPRNAPETIGAVLEGGAGFWGYFVVADKKPRKKSEIFVFNVGEKK